MVKEEENVVKTNLLDETLGEVSKQKAHQGEGMLHKAIIVIVKDSDGKYLITRRSNSKQLWPSFFDISIATHPKRGESYEEAAERRLKEELGIDIPHTLLKQIGMFSYFAKYGANGSESELCRVFLVENVSRHEITPNPKEISDCIFVGEEIKGLVHREDLTPWAELVIRCGYLNLI